MPEETAPEETEGSLVETPVLDLDAMLEDLRSGNLEGEEVDHPTADAERDADTSQPGSSTDDGGEEAGGDEDSRTVESVPPGMVAIGDDYVSETEARALLDLNRQVKEDPGKAAAIAAALGGHTAQEAPTPAPVDALPEWIDPDDVQAVGLYRQNRQIEVKLAEQAEAERRREAEHRVSQEQARRGQVVDAFREACASFRKEHPELDEADIKALADRAANLGMLANPEAVGGSLRGGFEIALDAALWSTPQYREQAMAGGTVPTKQQQSDTRKQKASALSSTSGSSPRTQSTEATPTTRSEVMQAGLAFLRDGAGVSD